MKHRMTNAIIQARMGSTRLPGKTMMNLEGIPILEHVIRRLNRVSEIDIIIVATSTKDDDDIIEQYCNSRNIPCVRGSEDNVLGRFGIASTRYPADVYVRATADNPMIDIRLVEKMLSFFYQEELTYTCYKKYPIGSGVEIFSSESLLQALNKADRKYELEHVTPYMYERMDNRNVRYYTSIEDDSNIRLTIDTERDFLFAKELFTRLYEFNPYFGICEIKELLSRNMHLMTINADVHQKTISE